MQPYLYVSIGMFSKELPSDVDSKIPMLNVVVHVTEVWYNE